MPATTPIFPVNDANYYYAQIGQILVFLNCLNYYRVMCTITCVYYICMCNIVYPQSLYGWRNLKTIHFWEKDEELCKKNLNSTEIFFYPNKRIFKQFYLVFRNKFHNGLVKIEVFYWKRISGHILVLFYRIIRSIYIAHGLYI